ncbi:MAG: phosphoesterase, partial [Bacteroidetes bacterium B1(2017)]
MKSSYTLLFYILLSLSAIAQLKEKKILEVPGKNQYAQININGTSVLPSGRWLTPAGELVRITHDPFGMCLSPDGKKAVTIHNGVFTIIELDKLTTTRIPSYDKKDLNPLGESSFIGVAFAEDNNTLYLSGGDNGAVIVFDIKANKVIDSLSLNGTVDGKKYEDSFTSDLIFKQDELLILDRGNFRLVRYDLKSKTIKKSIDVGRQPFGLALSKDKKMAFVANVGMYSYPLVEGTNEKNYNEKLISRHPYGDNTKESINGTTIDGQFAPGVGSPLSPEAMSIFSIDLNTNSVVDKYKTGHQIGEMVEDAEVVGGASPNSIAVGSKYIYVTNATNDNISVIDYKAHKIVSHIPIKIDKRIDKYRGALPFGITLSKDEKTL